MKHVHIISPCIILLVNNASFLWEVVSILKNHSEIGVLHENTILIMMGDHGQTLKVDHGGGIPKEATFGISIFSSCFPFTNTNISLITSRNNYIIENGVKTF